MDEDVKKDRRRRIESAAYELLAEKGYNGFSMLSVAKRAKASNETLYRWYGDKQGLFKTMVAHNAAEVSGLLEADIAKHRPPKKTLESLAPLLLRLLVGKKAIALNRAAAADATGELGAAITEAGRNSVFPLIVKVFEEAKAQRVFVHTSASVAAELYVTLLVGDLQIRRAIGGLDELSDGQITARARKALTQLYKFLDVN